MLSKRLGQRELDLVLMIEKGKEWKKEHKGWGGNEFKADATEALVLK